MCTICGHFSLTGKAASNDIFDMLYKMHHRGPDSHGVYLDGRVEKGETLDDIKDCLVDAKIAMGHQGIRRDHPDYYSVVIANQILSGSFGARLFSNIRSKQGLAYDVNGGVGFQWDYPGMAILSMSTKIQTTEQGIDALIAESRKMVSNPPTEDEVANAKASILNSFVFSVDSPSKVLGKYLFMRPP